MSNPQTIQKNFGTTLFSDKKFKSKFNNILFNKTSLNNPFLKYAVPFTVPDIFDGRKTWDKLINPIQQQSLCVSCWAFASLFVLSARLSIYTNGKYNLQFSPAKMIFLKATQWNDVKDQLSKGIPADYANISDKTLVVNKCEEGSLLDAWQYLYSFGVPDSSCVDDNSRIDNIYASNILFSDTFDVCPTNNQEMIHHRIEGYYHVPGTISKDINIDNGTEYNIRKDIYHWGPCSTVMRVFQDFLDWDGLGIYQWDGSSALAGTNGHAVVIIGWDTDSITNTPYWICRNSWGQNWGDNGYFKIIRGVNHCEIEENVFVGYPTLPAFRLFVEYPILYTFEDLALRGVWGILDNGYKLTSFEKVVLKQPHNFDKNKINFIYAMQYWPDFSKLIAGDLSSLVYHIGNVNPPRKKIKPLPTEAPKKERPREVTPQESPSQEVTPQEERPREVTPQEVTPKKEIPQEETKVIKQLAKISKNEEKYYNIILILLFLFIIYKLFIKKS